MLQHSGLDSDSPAMRVLVVDDDADNRDTTTVLVQLRGHEVRTASCGPDAIELVKTFSPDLVMLDIAMPAMDGIKVASAVRRMSAIQPPAIAAITGYGDAFHKQRCAEAGFDFFLLKPLNANEYDYLLWIASQTASVRDAFQILEAKHKTEFYAFAVSQLEFAWLILDFSAAQDVELKQRSLEKVQQMQGRTAKWLKMAGGFTDKQRLSLQMLLAALQDRLTTMTQESPASPINAPLSTRVNVYDYQRWDGDAGYWRVTAQMATLAAIQEINGIPLMSSAWLVDSNWLDGKGFLMTEKARLAPRP